MPSFNEKSLLAKTWSNSEGRSKYCGFTFSNSIVWSFLIAIHVGIVVRPITFLPLPVCLITGPAKYLGFFYGGHFQVFVGVLLLVNKATAYMLCLSTHFFAFRFPIFVRRLRLSEGAMLFAAVHLAISGVLILSAYVSGFFDETVPFSQDLLKDCIRIYSPSKFSLLKPLIDDSLIIGVLRESLHCFYTWVYLLISLTIIITNVVLMLYAIVVLYFSLKTDKSENTRNYKKRLITMILLRTLIPMITFNLPAFFIVYVVEFDKDDTSAFVIQWCLLLILFSPAICCLTTIVGLRPYRKALCGLIQLKISRFIERRSESESEKTSETTTKHAVRNNRVAAVYSTTISNNEDYHNNNRV